MGGMFKPKSKVAAAATADVDTERINPMHAVSGGPAFQSVAGTLEEDAAEEGSFRSASKVDTAATADVDTDRIDPIQAVPGGEEAAAAAPAPPADTAASPAYVDVVQDVQARARTLADQTTRFAGLLHEHGEPVGLDKQRGAELAAVQRSAEQIRAHTTGLIAELQGSLRLPTDDTSPVNQLGHVLTEGFDRVLTISRSYGTAALAAGEKDAAAGFLAVADVASLGSRFRDHAPSMPALGSAGELEAQQQVSAKEKAKKRAKQEATSASRWVQLADLGVTTAKYFGAFSAGVLAATLSPSLAIAGGLLGLVTGLWRYRNGLARAEELRKLGATLSDEELAAMASSTADRAEDEATNALMGGMTGGGALVGGVLALVGVFAAAPALPIIAMILGGLFGIAGAALFVKRWMERRQAIADAGADVITAYLEGGSAERKDARKLIVDAGGGKVITQFEQNRERGTRGVDVVAGPGGFLGGKQPTGSLADVRGLARPVGKHLRQLAKARLNALSTSLVDSLSCGVPSREVQVEQLLTSFGLKPDKLREQSSDEKKRPAALKEAYYTIKKYVL